MNHGIVDVFAYQEAILIEVLFGVAVLAMIWAGLRRWLHVKEKTARLLAEQAAERTAQYCASVARVEERLNAIEQMLDEDYVNRATQIGAQ